MNFPHNSTPPKRAGLETKLIKIKPAAVEVMAKKKNIGGGANKKNK